MDPRLELLYTETKAAFDWSHRLLEDIPQDQWSITPEVLETNVLWQAGHLVMSSYFNGIMCVNGHDKELMIKIGMRDLDGIFNQGKPVDAPSKISNDRVIDALNQVQLTCLAGIQSFNPDDLNAPLEPTRFKNPVANTKQEAFTWNVQHTMWHCGQLALLKRILGKRFDFSKGIN
jgi:hypothetical protein